MRPADTWKDYELLDATDGNRLERWGETILIRPDPQVVWKTPKQSPLWAKADAVYHRSNQGGGEWEYKRRIFAHVQFRQQIKLAVQILQRGKMFNALQATDLFTTVRLIVRHVVRV